VHLYSRGVSGSRVKHTTNVMYLHSSKSSWAHKIHDTDRKARLNLFKLYLQGAQAGNLDR
jgi:hypothetical protein